MTRVELARRMGHSQAVASEHYWRGITHEEGVTYFNIGLPEGAGPTLDPRPKRRSDSGLLTRFSG
jgi:hypothetical protein